MRFFNGKRNELSNWAQNQRKRLMDHPYSPAKKLVANAVFKYLTNVIEERSDLQLAITAVKKRCEMTLNILEEHLKLSDDEFIAKVRAKIKIETNTNSQFRQEVLKALDKAQADLESRRRNTTILIVGSGVLLVACYPVVGAIAATATAAAMLNFSLPFKSLCNEILEVYDTTGILPHIDEDARETHCGRIGTTYHRALAAP